MFRLRASVSRTGLASVEDLTMYPVALEAVLRAEVALFAQLLAVRTLQLAGVVVAVLAGAFARGGRVSSHRVGDGGVSKEGGWVALCVCAGTKRGREKAVG